MERAKIYVSSSTVMPTELSSIIEQRFLSGDVSEQFDDLAVNNKPVVDGYSRLVNRGLVARIQENELPDRTAVLEDTWRTDRRVAALGILDPSLHELWKKQWMKEVTVNQFISWWFYPSPGEVAQVASDRNLSMPYIVNWLDRTDVARRILQDYLDAGLSLYPKVHANIGYTPVEFMARTENDESVSGVAIGVDTAHKITEIKRRFYHTDHIGWTDALRVLYGGNKPTLLMLNLGEQDRHELEELRILSNRYFGRRLVDEVAQEPQSLAWLLNQAIYWQRDRGHTPEMVVQIHPALREDHRRMVTNVRILVDSIDSSWV